MQCRGLAFLITWSILATTALVAKAIDWADYCFERSDIFDYDHDEVIAPLRLVDLQKKRRKSHGHDHDHGPGPVIPEPMVFDLVRPLNALQGQFEANVLAIFPMKRGPAGAAGLPDAIGAVPLPGKTQGIEWAPEFEWCPRDGVTWEAEFPFIEDRFEAAKVAHQRMLGTGFDDHFIHGWQAIGLSDFDSGTTTLAGLWVAGWRWNRTWSAMGMFGGRQEFGGRGFQATEYLQNISLFADVSDDLVLGMESNYQQQFTGPAALLLLPQFHWQINHCLNFQGGAGYRFADEGSLPEAAIRVILTN
jgi:hypothetical protein